MIYIKFCIPKYMLLSVWVNSMEMNYDKQKGN